jgi:hypothetical protein
LAIADTGAISQESLALTTFGMWFHSPAGIRLLNNSGTMDPKAGMDTDPLTIGADYAAAIVVPQYTQVRWYSRDSLKPSIILDYSSNSWNTWTGLTCVGACFWPNSNLAIISKQIGDLWIENDQVFTDAGAPYEMVVKLAWLHAGQLGDFQRFRRFALFGESALGVNIRCRVFYDERPFHDEEFMVSIPSDSHFNDSGWGGSTWGTSGPWGDDDNLTVQLGKSLWFRDGVFKFRHRPARQKCSVFTLEFSDSGTTNSGFIPIVVAVEIARKKGLDRIPTT